MSDKKKRATPVTVGILRDQLKQIPEGFTVLVDGVEMSQASFGISTDHKQPKGTINITFVPVEKEPTK